MEDGRAAAAVEDWYVDIAHDEVVVIAVAGNCQIESVEYHPVGSLTLFLLSANPLGTALPLHGPFLSASLPTLVGFLLTPVLLVQDVDLLRHCRS